MSKIIFGYEINNVWKGGYSFSVYKNGIANTKKLSVSGKIIESKNFSIPQSVVDNIKKYLLEQKNLIENLPKEIFGFTVDGGWCNSIIESIQQQNFVLEIFESSNKFLTEFEEKIYHL